jgi:hypothetical protein
MIAFLFAEEASRPRITDLRVAVDARQVEVSFQLRGAFGQRLREQLQAGLPTGFSFQVRLYRDRQRWWDNEIDETELSVAAMYNAVNKEYLVNFKQDGRLTRSEVIHDPAELERAMTAVIGVPTFRLGELTDRPRLLVRVRARVGTDRLLGLIPTWSKTEWAESRKFRVP